MTSPNQPLVSIVIPLYNAEDFVGETLRSIINQTYQNLEILIFDDCSTDRSVEVVRSFDDPRIKLSTNPHNLGPAGNWNRALSCAAGTYIKLVCCDDTLDPSCIERQVAILENPANTDVGLVGCARKIVNSKGRTIMVRGCPDTLAGKQDGRQVIKQLIRWGSNPIGEPVSGLFRRSLVAQVGEYRAYAGYAIDVDYWVRLLSVSNLYFINEPLCAFRISQKSWSARLGVSQFRDFRGFMRETAANHRPLIGQLDLLSGTARSAASTIARVMIFKLFA